MSAPATSPLVLTRRTDGFRNPRWRGAAERFTLTDGRCVYMSTIIEDPTGAHGRDHKGRSTFLPADRIAARIPFTGRAS